MKISFTKKQYLGFASVLLMLVIWQLLAMYFNSDFIMPSPGKTFMTVIRLFTDRICFCCGDDRFTWTGRIFISAVLGQARIIAGISPGFNAFLNPFL